MKKKNEILPYYQYKKRNLFQKYFIEILILILGIGIIGLVFIADTYSETDTLNPENAAQLGDFIGGFIGTIFTLVSVILIYSTFNNQRISSELEKFENKYFELLKYQRDNVAEIGIGKDYGRKIFVLLIREFREILNIVKLVQEIQEIKLDKDNEKEKEQQFKISYHVLFFGVGPNSSRQLIESLKEYDEVFVNKLIQVLDSKTIKDKSKESRKMKYTPFEGHQSRLGHYYRHFYQTVKFVDQQKLDINKESYIKTLRAQLSTHEQALFYVNSLSNMGKVWHQKENNLITKYKLVKNIPPLFFDPITELNLEKKFPAKYFEYQED